MCHMIFARPFAISDLFVTDLDLDFALHLQIELLLIMVIYNAFEHKLCDHCGNIKHSIAHMAPEQKVHQCLPLTRP